MKVAFTTGGDNLSAPLEQRFGRAPKFLVCDLDSGAFEVADNVRNLNAAQGAGIQSAQAVAKLGAGALVSGHCGPKAFRVLSAAGVKIYPCAAATVGEALEQYVAGALAEAGAPDVEGHWV